MKSRFMKRMLSFILATVLLMGNVMPVMAEGSVSGNEVAETVVEETVVEESAVSEEPVSESEVNIEEESSEVSTTETTEETSSVESTTEESTEEATTEVSTEETTEETTEESVSENEIPEDELSVSANEIIDEEVPLASALPVTLEPVTVNGITITVSGPASAFAEGTTVSAVEVEPAEVVIEAAEESEQAEVKRYKAFDINLVCNGEVVQPLNGEEITVNFEGDLLIPNTDEEEDVVVYHVDDNDEITKMEAEVATVETEDAAQVETVEMTTTHFSTYVILVTGEEGKVEVTVNHYLVGTGDESSRLFVSDIKTVERGGSISEFDKGLRDRKNPDSRRDYNIQSIQLKDGNEVSTITLTDGKYVVDPENDTVEINIFYSPVTETEDVGIEMYDYRDGNASSSNSINNFKNYSGYREVTIEEARYLVDWGQWIDQDDFRRNKEYYDSLKNKRDNNWSNRFATKGAAGDYNAQMQNTRNEWKNANDYNTGWDGQIIKGLLLGVTDGGYGDVNFKFEDPGFFTTEAKIGKIPYNNFALHFSKNGLEYNLVDVKENGRRKNVSLDDFFPLKGKPYSDGDKNEYFGIRHDFTFQIGDYVGEMMYEFSGDDDLWVCLDGNVILDLGGIHGKVGGKTDVWKVLTGIENSTYEQRVEYLNADADNDGIKNNQEVFRISVIYMERGGSKSNCNMKFVMPNVLPSEPNTSEAPKANVELIKTDAKTNESISGVGFILYNDEECKEPKTQQLFTDTTGKLTITGLRVGTYYLKETTPPENYQVEDVVYTVEVSLSGDKAVATVKDADGSVLEKNGAAFVIKNTPIEDIDLIFVKVDAEDTTKTLDGAEFTLTDTSDDSFVAMTAVSDENGQVKFEGVGVGTYVLKETKAPNGYIPSEETLTITVEEKNGVLEYTVTGNEDMIWLQYEKQGDTHYLKNTKPVDIEIIKEWKNYKGEMLAESKIKSESITVELFREVEGMIATKEKVQDVVLAKEGDWKAIVEDLPSTCEDGQWKYSIEEITTDDLADFEATYRVENDQNKPDTIILVITNTELVGNLKITKTVDKVDSVHGIAAFTFKITCPDESILYRTISFEGDLATDTSKEVVIKNLPVGSYKVEELTALRYECKSENPQEKDVAKNATTEYFFRNEKEYDGNYSHTDVIVNKVVFEKDADGNIIGATTSQEKSSTSDVVTE